ncbi:MAG TPA: hypothetical protein VI137_05890 [Pseudolabrys sp.]
MTKLASFTPLQIAEKAVTENIDLLDRLTDQDSKEAQDAPEIDEGAARSA